MAFPELRDERSEPPPLPLSLKASWGHHDLVGREANMEPNGPRLQSTHALPGGARGVRFRAGGVRGGRCGSDPCAHAWTVVDRGVTPRPKDARVWSYNFSLLYCLSLRKGVLSCSERKRSPTSHNFHMRPREASGPRRGTPRRTRERMTHSQDLCQSRDAKRRTLTAL